MDFVSIIVSLSSSHEYSPPLVKFVGHIGVIYIQLATQLYSANFSRRADLAIIIYPKKKPPLLKKKGGIIGIIAA